jgi:hypothetical protein
MHIYIYIYVCISYGTRASLPEHIIAAYASWGECDGKVLEAAVNGANVIIWFAITLQSNEVLAFIPRIYVYIVYNISA